MIRTARAALPFLALAALLLAGSARAQTWLWEIPHGLEPGLKAPGYVPGELLVKFKANSKAADRSLAAAEEGDQVVSDVTDDGLVKVKLGPGQTVESVIDRWNGRADVEYAAPNLYARGFFVPNDSLIAQYDLAWNLREVQAYDAWDVVTGDPRIVVAIIDSGVAYENRDVPDYEQAHLWPGTTRYAQSVELPGPFRPGWDFVNDDAYADDDNGHGTTVATIVAGAANNVAGSAGIAFGVTLLPIKVLDYRNDSSMEWIVKGIRFAADQGADIANLSLGFPPVGTLRYLGFTEPMIQHLFNPLRDAVNYAQSRGTILVAAAGNFGVPEVSYPAAFPGVIAVGATSVDHTLASYTSYGFDMDFMAPGGGFDDLNNDHVQDGLLIYSIKPYRSEGSLAKPDSFGVFVSFGTSDAAPHVTGAVALLRSLGLTQQGQIVQTLKATALDPWASKPGSDPAFGAGLIQIADAVRNPVPAAGTKAAQFGDGGAIDARIASGNPSRGAAALHFRTARAGLVSARVYDVRGALVRTLTDRVVPAGEATLRWDGRRNDGAPAPSGVYFIRVETPDGAATRKVAFLR
ncbi:MAG: S8 family serine peptidase [Hyphomicrobiales bacterium]